MSKTGEKPIRVAHVIGKWVGGGLEAIVLNYYKYLDRSQVQFDFIVDIGSPRIPREEIEQLGGRIIIVPRYEDVFHYIRELARIFREENYTIVHSHINTMSVFPLCAAWISKVPIRIAHSHSTSNKKEKKKDFIKKCLRPLAKNFATDYFCCSELAGRWLFGNRTYNKGNVYLLRNAIDTGNFRFSQKSRVEKRNELQIKENQILIGHIGRFVTQKNHSFLIKVFQEIHRKNKETILVMVGEGPLLELMKQKVKELQLDEAVIFTGQRCDTNELYSAFDVLLLPSLYEGLPVVGVESQTAGLPCIMSDEITKEIKVLDSTKLLPFSLGAKRWAEEVLDSFVVVKRKDTSQILVENGFDIHCEAHKLEVKYKELLQREKLV